MDRFQYNQYGGRHPPRPRFAPSNHEVCRNYLRNVCQRGNCKFDHPRVREMCPDDLRLFKSTRNFNEYSYNGRESRNKPFKSWFNVCYDFQNGSCQREDCRYFHLTDSDEEIFKKKDELPQELLEQAIEKTLNVGLAFDREVPFCKDFVKKSCSMKNCKYEHLSPFQFETELKLSLYKELKAHYKQLDRKRQIEQNKSPNKKQCMDSEMSEEKTNETTENEITDETTENIQEAEVKPTAKEEREETMETNLNENRYCGEVEKLRSSNESLIKENAELYDKCLLFEEKTKKAESSLEGFTALKELVTEQSSKLIDQLDVLGQTVDLENSRSLEITNSIDELKSIGQNLAEGLTPFVG